MKESILKNKAKDTLKKIGITPERICQRLAFYSLKCALAQQELNNLVIKLRKIVPDISNQESTTKENFNAYWEFKRRGLQSFQCSLMLRALKDCLKRDLTVVDIGDSAGTHMLYLKELTKGNFNVDTISVNLDHRAIEKIKARKLKAIQCRAEDLDLGERNVDLFTSFQMVEHLSNPAIFFRRLAKKSTCNRFVVTVPYLKRSRVGLYQVRNKSDKNLFAEDLHMFELNPQDWALLMMHSGWKVVYSKIYYQYPRRLPLISLLLALFWKKTDFEGFWGIILEKDTSISDLYQDWEE